MWRCCEAFRVVTLDGLTVKGGEDEARWDVADLLCTSLFLMQICRVRCAGGEGRGLPAVS